MNPVFCRSCPIAAYCSLNCRAADACHIEGGRECGQPWPLLLSDDARLALRLAAKLAKVSAGFQVQIGCFLKLGFKGVCKEYGQSNNVRSFVGGRQQQWKQQHPACEFPRTSLGSSSIFGRAPYCAVGMLGLQLLDQWERWITRDTAFITEF